MLRFLVDNWLAILSMIVAIAGGVPGILAFIEYFKDKPGFAFIVANWITGEIDGADHTRQPFIFLACTIANPGKQPLSPSHFELVLKVGRTRYGAEKMLIPESVQFRSEQQDIAIESPWRKDLQRFAVTVSPGLPVPGFLMFRFHRAQLADLRRPDETVFELTCVDVFGRRRLAKVIPTASPLGAETTYPKHGLRIRMPSSH